MTYFDGPTNRSTVIWEDNGFLHPYRFNRSSTGNSMLISFRSGWRLPRTYGFFFRIYCIPPAQGSSRTYNTKPEFCLSKSITKSKFSSRKPHKNFVEDQLWEHPVQEMKSNVRKYRHSEKHNIKAYQHENRYKCAVKSQKVCFFIYNLFTRKVIIVYKICHKLTYRLEKRKQDYSYLDLDHYQLPRQSTDPTKTELILQFPKECSSKFDAKVMFLLNRQRQISIPHHYTKPLENRAKSQYMSQLVSRSMRKCFKKGLGHDLYQLTKGNYHEVNLSPYSSLTVMVQPNKIDYSKRSTYIIII